MTRLQQTQAVVILEPSQVPVADTLAADCGASVQQVPQLGIEPVATVTLIIVGTAVAVSTVTRELEQRKGGQVIDLRPGAPKAFYRTPDVAYGTVIIVAVDGKVTVRVREPDSVFGKAIATLPELLSGSGDAKQVAKTVAKALGADVEVDHVTGEDRNGDV